MIPYHLVMSPLPEAWPRVTKLRRRRKTGRYFGRAKGVRLASLTEVIPKPLVPRGGMPIMAVVIPYLKAPGFNCITLGARYLADLTKA
jgi:hypothetical protein